MTEFQTTLSKNTPIVLTIGNFDGVHLGHQRLLHKVCQLAQELESTPVMATFSPHTLVVVRPGIELRYLTTLEEKLALAKQYGGVADSIVIQFTPEVAALPAEDFMNDLCSRFSIQGIVVGADFSLGRQRMGNIAFLKDFGLRHGIQVQSIELETTDLERISSTRIRKLMSEGRISETNSLLGHSVLLEGNVKYDDQRSTELGFPTALVHPDPHKLLPARGVYAVCVTVCDNDQSDPAKKPTVHKGIAHVGVRPTFNGNEHVVEVHLLDVEMHLYEKYLRVEFIEHLRGEQCFSGPEALKQQISVDVQQAHQILASRRVSH
jgi:riboflavin kinase / FMN adenylyltransferase